MFSNTVTSTLLYFSCLLILSPHIVASSKVNLDTLRQAQIIFRHGARTIDETYPSDPYWNESSWAPGYSQLTNLGKVQAYNLGLFLRERYNGFVKDTYDMKDIYVLSSDFARTLQTASSVLAGFYLPNQILLAENKTVSDYLADSSVEIPLPWKSVPIHTSPVEQDNLIRQQSSICPRYNHLFTNLRGDHEEVNRKFEENNDFMQYFSTNAEVQGFKRVLLSFDTLVTERLYNMTLPDWTNRLFETEKATNFFLYFFQMITYTEEMKRLRSGPLVERLIHNMVRNDSTMSHFDRARTGQKRLYLFSGHDVTLTGLLDTLGIFDKKRPPFTAAIILELHQDPNKLSPLSSEQDLYVEIHYRNETDREPYQLQIPGCPLRCPLSTFVSKYEPYIPADWRLECELKEEAPSASVLSPGLIVFIVLSVWLVLFVLLQCWMRGKCFKAMRERNDKKAYINIP